MAGFAGRDVAPLARLDELERRWIATAPRPGARADFEARLGADIFQRLSVADPHLGRGYIAGGETPASPLARAAEDPEVIERYLVNLLDYAYDTLSRERPDLVFCHRVDDAPTLALAVTASHLGIPFAQLRHTRIGKRVIVDTSPYDRLEPVRSTFETFVLTGAVPRELAGPAEAYLAAVRDAHSAPDYLAYHSRRVEERLRPSRQLREVSNSLRTAFQEVFGREIRCLRQPAPLALCHHEQQVARRTGNLLRHGPFRPTGWRPAGDFAFFPLHVEPEASTMVQSPNHTDQLAVIEAIAKNLPSGMRLLVKEHLPMLGRRPSGFYRRLQRLPAVELASPFEDGATLVRDAALTASISSTAAWEAMVIGRPTLIIAFPPFAMVNDGFVAETDLTRLGAAIRAALASPPADERRLLAYVAAALAHSFECPTETLRGPVTAETVRQNPQILAELARRLAALAQPDSGKDIQAYG